jgi:drug/metabolite transporter (DMT)-like permease
LTPKEKKPFEKQTKQNNFYSKERNDSTSALFIYSLMSQNLKYQLLLHIIIFIWGFTGILGKLIFLDAYQIVWFRVLFALVFLYGYFLVVKKPMYLNSKTVYLKIMGVGVIVAIHWLTFYQAIQLSTASFGILCLSTTTLHVTWLEPLLMRRPFSLMECFFSLLIIVGIYYVSGDLQPGEYPALIYGLLSAFFAALFSVFNARLVQTTSSYQITFYEMIAAFVFLSVVLFFRGELNLDLFNIRFTDLMWLLFLGIVCTSFAFLASIEVIKRLGTYTVSLSINLEPVYTILLAVVLLHEDKVLGSRFYFGALLILIVVILNSILKYYMKLQKEGKHVK